MIPDFISATNTRAVSHVLDRRMDMYSTAGEQSFSDLLNGALTHQPTIGFTANTSNDITLPDFYGFNASGNDVSHVRDEVSHVRDDVSHGSNSGGSVADRPSISSSERDRAGTDESDSDSDAARSEEAARSHAAKKTEKAADDASRVSGAPKSSHDGPTIHGTTRAGGNDPDSREHQDGLRLTRGHDSARGDRGSSEAAAGAAGSKGDANGDKKLSAEDSSNDESGKSRRSTEALSLVGPAKDVLKGSSAESSSADSDKNEVRGERELRSRVSRSGSKLGASVGVDSEAVAEAAERAGLERATEKVEQRVQRERTSRHETGDEQTRVSDGDREGRSADRGTLVIDVRDRRSNRDSARSRVDIDGNGRDRAGVRPAEGTARTAPLQAGGNGGELKDGGAHDQSDGFLFRTNVGSVSAGAPQGSESGGRFSQLMNPESAAAGLARHLREQGSADIVRQARIILRDNNEGELRLLLKPENLGMVRIRMEMEDNRVAMRIFVENQSAGDAFRESLSQLQRSFEESGLSTGSFEVSVDSGAADGSGDDGGAQHEFELNADSASNGTGNGEQDRGPAVSAAIEFDGAVGHVNVMA